MVRHPSAAMPGRAHRGGAGPRLQWSSGRPWMLFGENGRSMQAGFAYRRSQGEKTMSDVIVTQAGAELRIRFNRPEKKNALTGAMYQALEAALKRADDESGVRVVLLSGAGDTFTGGNDIKDFQASAANDGARPAASFSAALWSLTKPLVAAGKRSGHRHWHHHAGACGLGDRGALGAVRDAVHQPGPRAGSREFAAVSPAGRASAGQRPAAAG